MDYSELIDFVKELQEAGAVVNVNIYYDLEGQPDEPTSPEPPVDPEPPVEYTQVKVAPQDDRPRINARFVKGYNGVGKPIMEIYPSDSSDAGDRVQFNSGLVLSTIPGTISADGGGVYRELADFHCPAGAPKLYVRKEDVILV